MRKVPIRLLMPGTVFRPAIISCGGDTSAANADGSCAVAALSGTGLFRVGLITTF